MSRTLKTEGFLPSPSPEEGGDNIGGGGEQEGMGESS